MNPRNHPPKSLKNMRDLLTNHTIKTYDKLVKNWDELDVSSPFRLQTSAKVAQKTAYSLWKLFNDHEVIDGTKLTLPKPTESRQLNENEVKLWTINTKDKDKQAVAVGLDPTDNPLDLLGLSFDNIVENLQQEEGIAYGLVLVKFAKEANK